MFWKFEIIKNDFTQYYDISFTLKVLIKTSIHRHNINELYSFVGMTFRMQRIEKKFVKNVPIVDMNVVVNALSENLNNIHVFPTPESPINSNLNNRSYVFFAIFLTKFFFFFNKF